MSRIYLLIVGALAFATATAQNPVLRKGVSVKMPVTTSAVAMPDADSADSLIVAVTMSGAVYLEVTKVTLAQLSGNLKAALAGQPRKRVYLKGDARVQFATVAEVLDALKTAGVNAPILLSDQRDSSDTGFVPPKGLEVLVSTAPGGTETVRLKTGQGHDGELKQHARRGRPVVLLADAEAAFGEVVHAADVCHAAGAMVFVEMARK